MPTSLTTIQEVALPEIQITGDGTKPILIIPLFINIAIDQICKKLSDIEWTVYGMVEHYRPNVFVLTNLIVPDEFDATPVRTKVSAKERGKCVGYIMKHETEGVDLTSKFKLHAHSHHGMGVSWSQIDIANMEEYGGFNDPNPKWYLALVVNNKGEKTASYLTNIPKNQMIDMDIQVRDIYLDGFDDALIKINNLGETLATIKSKYSQLYEEKVKELKKEFKACLDKFKEELMVEYQNESQQISNQVQELNNSESKIKDFSERVSDALSKGKGTLIKEPYTFKGIQEELNNPFDDYQYSPRDQEQAYIDRKNQTEIDSIVEEAISNPLLQRAIQSTFNNKTSSASDNRILINHGIVDPHILDKVAKKLFLGSKNKKVQSSLH